MAGGFPGGSACHDLLAQGTGRRAQGTGHRAQGTGRRAQGTGHRARLSDGMYS
ncbi:MAG: hypothetical protein IPI69_03295 [Bacteroidales bacterium]|nr:hypothetical protein [Bacteroidales bacterium]